MEEENGFNEIETLLLLTGACNITYRQEKSGAEVYTINLGEGNTSTGATLKAAVDVLLERSAEFVTSKAAQLRDEAARLEALLPEPAPTAPEAPAEGAPATLEEAAGITAESAPENAKA